MEASDLGRGLFDAAFSRFGVMFFSDPAAAFADIRASLKPSGRLAFVCWRPLRENLWMQACKFARNNGSSLFGRLEPTALTGC